MIKKTPDTSGLVTTTVLNTKLSEFENSSFVTTPVLNTKIGEVENKPSDHAKNITTTEFNRLTAENFTARFIQANLVSKTDFDYKLISFNRKINNFTFKNCLFGATNIVRNSDKENYVKSGFGITCDNTGF